MDEIFFNTVNKFKVVEIDILFKDCKINKHYFNNPVQEILSENLQKVIVEKAAEAYRQCKVPITVEHGALQIEYLKNLPGALSKPFWDLIGDQLCDLIPEGESRKAKACSAVCYCDGIKRYYFIACTEGFISDSGRGTNGFQWDPIFIPNGSTKTYAEMELDEKLKFSQAAKAYKMLRKHLKI